MPPKEILNSKRNLVDIHNYKENEKINIQFFIRICDEMLYVSFALFMEKLKGIPKRIMNTDKVRERKRRKETWKMSYDSISARKYKYYSE